MNRRTHPTPCPESCDECEEREVAAATPITDAALGRGTNWHKPLSQVCVPVAVSRALERERADLRETLDTIANMDTISDSLRAFCNAALERVQP